MRCSGSRVSCSAPPRPPRSARSSPRRRPSCSAPTPRPSSPGPTRPRWRRCTPPAGPRRSAGRSAASSCTAGDRSRTPCSTGARSGWRTPRSGGSATRTWPRSGTAADMQASACLPLRVEDRDLGAVVFSFLAPRGVLRRGARVPGGGHRAVRAGPRPGAAAGRRADGAGDGGAPARPDDLPEPHHAPDGGAAVGRGAAAAARRPGRLRDRRLVRRAPACAATGWTRWRSRTATRRRSRSSRSSQERYPPDPDAPGGALQVSRTGEPAYYPEIPDELLIAAAVDDEHLALIRSIGMRSALVVPLAVRGRKLGALTLVQAESERRFDRTDLAFAAAAGGDRGRRAGQRPPLRAAVAHRAHPAGRAAARPTCPRCPGCAWPRATAPPTERRRARRRRPLRRRAGAGRVRRRGGRRLRQGRRRRRRSPR